MKPGLKRKHGFVLMDPVTSRVHKHKGKNKNVTSVCTLKTLSAAALLMSSLTSACSRFFAIPELRLSLSEHIEQKTDLSNLARLDRVSHSLLTPHLFSCIDIRLKDILLIAQAFRARPEIAHWCLALRVRSPDFQDVRSTLEERRRLYKIKCTELAFVLQCLSRYGRVAVFEWLWEPGWLEDDEVPEAVWEALQLNAPSLQKVDISLSKVDGATLSKFASNAYRRLQAFKIDLTHAHGWNGSKLRDMLFNAPDLVTLNLTLPTCCGQQDLALTSTHPGLRSFSFRGSVLSGMSAEGEPLTKDFLKRHTALEYLDLCCQTPFEVDDEDLPKLRALSIDHATSKAVELFSQSGHRPIKALRLVHMPHLTVSTVFNLCTTVVPTLKYLHMDSSIFSFRANLPGFADLLLSLPNLEELRLGAESVCAFQTQHRLCEDDLDHFLALLSDENAPLLRAISFCDTRGKRLTECGMHNLLPLPKALTEIAWDVCGTRYVYRIVERSETRSRAVLVSTARRKAQRLWVQDSLIDHFGDEVNVW